ncbi:MAG: ABC transporter permease [Chloroflexota bacterium]
MEETSLLSTVPAKHKPASSIHFLVRLLWVREFALILMIVFIGLALHLLTGHFLTTPNLNAIALGFATSAIIVLGMTAALVSGGFDLSVGSVFAVGGVTVAVALRAKLPIPIAILYGLGIGLLAGLVNGLLITKVRINPFITTLGMLGIARGASLAITVGTPIGIHAEDFLVYGQGKFLEIPNLILIALFVILIGNILMRRSVAFRQIYYIGGNEEAARLSGINADQVKTGFYVLAGTLAALAGVLLVSRFTVADPGTGNGEKLRIIAACIIGGCSLSRGKEPLLAVYLASSSLDLLITA